MNADDVMDKIRRAFARSGMTLTELGEGLGYEGPTARKRAWSLLYRTLRVWPRGDEVVLVTRRIGAMHRA